MSLETAEPRRLNSDRYQWPTRLAFASQLRTTALTWFFPGKLPAETVRVPYESSLSAHRLY